ARELGTRRNVRLVPGVGQLVEDDDVLTRCNQPLSEVRADEPGPSCDQDPHPPRTYRLHASARRRCLRRSRGAWGFRVFKALRGGVSMAQVESRNRATSSQASRGEVVKRIEEEGIEFI